MRRWQVVRQVVRQLAALLWIGLGGFAAWAAVDALLQEAMPVAWLYNARGVQGRSRRLQGVTMDLRGELATVTRWHREGEP